MKHGLSTLALLCGGLIPLSAYAQAPADEQQPPSDQSDPDLESTDAEPADDESTEPSDSTDDEAPTETESTDEDELDGEPAAAASAELPAAEPSADDGTPPEYEYDASLDPEVYYEGDSDPHNPGYVPGFAGHRSIGLSPWAPRFGAMPGGVTAPATSDTWDEEWQFVFHGYMESTLRAGIGTRDNPATGQSETVFHATPVVPGRYGDFEATQAVPGPWVQMNFAYGNPYVSATAIIAGFNQQSGASYNYPSSQLGLNDIYLTLNAPRMQGFRLRAHAGAFQDRYGAMAQYSEGNYGHSLIAYTRGTGATVLADFDFLGDLVGLIEVGMKGTIDKPPLGILPNDANAYGDAQNGAGYVGHGHFGVVWGELDISAHYLHAFTKDNRLPDSPLEPGEPIPIEDPDGSITTYGLTARAIGEPYGHFFTGVGYTVARDSRHVPRVINILNADGGRGLMDEYFGTDSRGNGELLHAGFQYDASLQKFLKYPAFFNGAAPDLRASIFGTYVHVWSADKDGSEISGFHVDFDDVDKLKVGTELTYSILPWVGVSARYDYVSSDLSNSERSFQIVSPKIFLRTSFLAHEQFNLRYTRWFYGDEVLIQTVAPNPPQGLDEQMIALQANMWW